MAITIRVGLLQLLLLLLPNLLLIYLIESGNTTGALTMSVTMAAGSLILLLPMAKLVTYLIIGRELQKMNRLCREVRKGQYGGFFNLPLEQEDENELIRLKRNMNWMLHSIASREQLLQNQLNVATQTREEFEKLSYVDGLTGIFNRRYFEEVLPQCIHNSCADREILALVMIDCDGFKQVNDQFGHQAGDTVLQLLGGLLKSSVREGQDYPFRYGGDEFGVILRNIPLERVGQITEQIRHDFEHDNDMGCTLSIGIAHLTGSSRCTIDASQLKSSADKALYTSKENGKNRIVITDLNQPQPA